MKATDYSKIKDGTLLFGNYTVHRFKAGGGIRRGSAGINDWTATSGHSNFFTTPEEYFAVYPEATVAQICTVKDGEFVYGSGTFWKYYLNKEDTTQGYLLDWTRINQQRDEAKTDGSLATAQAMTDATAQADNMPVVTAETHEPVPGENFRRYGKRDLPAFVKASRRAVALGCKAVILHNLPGEKYGMRWSPARPKSDMPAVTTMGFGFNDK